MSVEETVAEPLASLPSVMEAVDAVGTRWMFACCGCLVCLGGAVASTRLAPVLLLGSSSTLALAFAPILAVWTFGVATIVRLALDMTLAGALRLRSQRTFAIVDNQSSMLVRMASALVPIGLVIWVIPWQLAFVLLFLVQAASAVAARKQVRLRIDDFRSLFSGVCTT